MVILGVLCSIAALTMNLLVMFLKQARLSPVFTGAVTASAIAGTFVFL